MMEQSFRQAAALVGDPTRATILWTLLDGKALTATELAIAADTTPQNISMHLNKLLQADLLSAEQQGRHRYYRFSRKDIAYAIEAIAALVPASATKHKDQAEITPAIKYCRTCYDHLAGKIGVAICDSLVHQKIVIEQQKEFSLSKKGEKWFAGFDIDASDLKKQRRSFIRPCLDWSERRYHIAGSLASSLLDTMLAADWIRRTRNSRAIVITASGEKEMEKHFKISSFLKNIEQLNK
jgi:DNA-binding transcriptional ArsR family regulator